MEIFFTVFYNKKPLICLLLQKYFLKKTFYEIDKILQQFPILKTIHAIIFISILKI